MFSAKQSHRLDKTLRERMHGGEISWRAYEDLGMGGADARCWAQALHDWHQRHGELLQWDERRKCCVFPRSVRVIVSDGMNTFLLGQP